MRAVMAKATGGYIQQLPSGSFRVSVYAGTDPLTGRQIRLRKTCKTERAGQIELGKLLEQAARRMPAARVQADDGEDDPERSQHLVRCLHDGETGELPPTSHNSPPVRGSE
jgi:hypothetical protein